MLGQVDARGVAPWRGEADEVRSCADADLEHALSPRALEVRKARDERLELVAALLDLGVELGLALRRLRMDDAARFVLPEAPNQALLVY